jgi:CheY-like chemotaxis protein
LVIEDNKDNREIILDFLSAYGFSVLSAEDGEQGIQSYKTNHPDLVLCDVLLPKVNGFGVCEAIKNDDESVPVILMSALYKTHALQAEARDKYGADDYLLKPLNLVDLSERICGLLSVSKDSLKEPAAPCLTESAEVPDSGNFNEFPPPLILCRISSEKRTGIFHCQGAGKKTLYFHNGDPIYVTSDDPAENYIAMLVRDGKITKDQKEQAESESKEKRVPISKLLISDKIVSNADIAGYMIKEVHDRLTDLVTWKKGTYRFLPDESFLKKIKRPAMNLPQSVYAGITRANLKDYLAGRYSSLMNSIIHKNEEKLILVARLDMSNEDLETFVMIDGETTLASIINNSSGNSDQILKAIFTLEMLEIIFLDSDKE